MPQDDRHTPIQQYRHQNRDAHDRGSCTGVSGVSRRGIVVNNNADNRSEEGRQDIDIDSVPDHLNPLGTSYSLAFSTLRSLCFMIKFIGYEREHSYF